MSETLANNTGVIETRYLHPGNVIVASEPLKVVTILGSCVAVTLFCPRLKVGAISHSMLPERSRYRSEGYDSKFTYVDESIHFMLEELAKLGVTREELEVKVFGGASGMPSSGGISSVNVSERNVEKAFFTLNNSELDVIAQDVGGATSRKLYFYPHLGDVYMKYVKSSLIN